MSRRDEWGWYKPAPKQPPPERGIRLKKSAATWWGQRWVEALERMSRGYSNRLARGRSYARAGRTHDLVVKAGRVSAKVTGSRPTPYTVTIALTKLGDAVWSKAIAAMAGKAQFSAELLAGEMPRDIDAAFKEAGASLFPLKETDLLTKCTCPDWANPCKHVAATHYVLGEALDRDPFLLFELRGHSKAQVLDALRAARMVKGSSGRSRKGAKRAAAPSGEMPTVVLGKLDAFDYDQARGPLPALHLSFEPVPVAGGLIPQLGKPSGWSCDVSPGDLLGPMIQRAADKARSLAMAEVQPAPDPDSM
ncbi:MAG: hypothetical protein ACREUX_16415 [Burkholderiales bacterium]